MDKKSIANEKIVMRNQLDSRFKQSMDQEIHAQVLEKVSSFQSIALFVSFGNEIETHTLIEKLLKKDFDVYLPRVEGKQMNFYKIDNLGDLKPSVMGILEPYKGNPVSKKELDAIIVPMLAFNEKKYRIGYGGGYYDGYLKDYQGLKIGIAYSFQKTNKDFVEEHDIACDVILNERVSDEKEI